MLVLRYSMYRSSEIELDVGKGAEIGALERIKDDKENNVSFSTYIDNAIY